jgi:glucokinase
MPAGCVIGVDLGGTKLLAGVVDPALDVHHRAHRLARGRDEAEVVETVVSAVQEIRDASGRPIDGVGFGIPSLVDLERGTAVSTVHLPLHDMPFRDVMAERLGLPVWVDNDATAALLAEHAAGAARGASTAVMLTIGTGIGGALLVDGRIVRGARGAAGELGHMVVDLDGPRCPCGNVGCLEAVASGSALGREAARVAAMEPDSGLGRALAAGREITGMLCTELAHDGDEAAREVLALVGRRLGVGVASLVNALNPEVVVIGGGVIAAGDLLLDPVRAVVAQQAHRPSRDDVRIVPARFGAESGMIGAALMALDGLGLRPAWATA